MKLKELDYKKFLNKYWPLLVIFLLVTIFAGPYLFKGLVPFPADHLVTAFPPWQYYFGLPVKNNAMPDVVTQMYPWKHLTLEIFRSGQIPLWNPNNFSGNPFLGNYQSAVFHPLNFLFIFLPEVHAWSYLILLQPFLAGIFTFLFCRQLKMSQSAALMSSIAFMFCGFITVWMAYGTLAYSLLWLPLVLYGIERSFSKLSGFSLLLISFPMAASFFSGHLQISLYVTLFSLIYLVWRGVTLRKVKSFFLCLIFFILGILLASVQLLPSFELHHLSVRGSFLEINEIIPWQYLVTLFSPDFYGNPVTRNDWYGHYAEWSGFVGVVPLMLALLALLGGRNPLVFFFIVLSFASLILRHPTFLLDLILKFKVPVFSSSAAARINGLLSFSLAILAGFGFDQLRLRLSSKKLKAVLLTFSIFLLLVLGIWGILFFKSPFLDDQVSIAKRNTILPTAMVIVFFGTTLFFVLLVKLFRKHNTLLRRISSLILLFVILLASFDLFRFSNKWLPFDRAEHVYPQIPVLTFLNQENDHERVFGYFGMEMQNYFQIQGFNGYDPLYIQRYGELLKAGNDGRIKLPSTRGVSLGRRGKYTMKLLNLLNGRYILHAVEDKQFPWAFNYWDYPDQFKLVYKDEKYEVYRNLQAFPRAFMVYNYKTVKEPQAIVNQLLSEKTDLRKIVILEEDLEPLELKGLPESEPIVNIQKYSENKIDLTIESEKPGILFLSDNYYPGWKAYINSVEVKIYRANYSFRAIPVPEGEHEVSFAYHPFSFKMGAMVSALSLIAAGFVALSVSRRKK
ncbi:YfhO family protein [Patescibacteria group bacterium]